ncbi:LysM peptidoglycan-binding domain-containing protein [Massilia sp. TS11]|uniref:LysM peptidoglycan-binding domain-containing protein n=1 Tax=Massilia sp. TS11 TaxID=2908003 RepID=UPI001EDB072B|nr:LysM domain-containing protein [Massilia sp. TS11]MCG2585456.1 LysM peptidoglycan-binding domain-containing protein [Massilia sp. TS11]
MKNSSTCGYRFVAAACLIAAAVRPALAADCTILPAAPDQYQVVKGDTLWDISTKFLATPWCWPEVWGMNKDEIKNPHWIYPGQTIYLDREHKRLSLNKPGSADGTLGADGLKTFKLSPQLRTEGLGRDAVAAIPTGVIEPFLSQPQIVEDEDMKAAPRIAATQEGHLYLGKDDKAFVKGDLKGGTSFQVYRPGKPLVDPVTRQVVAHEAFYLGTVKLVQEAKGKADVHTFSVASSKQEMGVGDLLVPAPPTPMRNYVPHQPERQVEARVLGIYGGMDAGAQNAVVSLNRGALDGLDIGAVLQLYHAGKAVPDGGGDKGWFNLGSPKVHLPDEEYGRVFIFRVFKKVSYGLVMQVRAPVQVGDAARSPE